MLQARILPLPTSLSVSVSLAIRLYHPLLPVGLLDYTLCPYRAIVDKF